MDAITQVGQLINSDPKNHHSDIGKRIFDACDFNTAIAFTQVSKGLNTRAKKRWFVWKSQEIIHTYIVQNTGYVDYLKGGGWMDIVVVGAKVSGIALTITAGVKSGIHASRIPADAPRKTTIWIDDYGQKNEITYIDHPEATKSTTWALVAISSGIATTVGIGNGIWKMLTDINLEEFFSRAEEDIIGSLSTHPGFKLISPSFHNWKATKMKSKLMSNPPNWQSHPKLQNLICPLSNDFMLFPVKDKCGHYYDYRAVRAYQLDPTTENPLECPASRHRPNTGLSQLRFDKAKFDKIQRILNGG